MKLNSILVGCLISLTVVCCTDNGSISNTNPDAGTDGNTQITTTLAVNEPACEDSLDYQCGLRDICNKTLDYGSCDEGYSCVDNLCIAGDDLTCDGVVCPEGEYCSNGVCLLDVFGTTYFVATWGDDQNPGTFDEPFYSWQKAVDVSSPGDITYIRGGIWYPTEYPYSGHSAMGMLILGSEEGIGMSGTKEAPIRYYNYPKERPILDGSLSSPSQFRWSYGIGIGTIEYIYIKGLTIRHIHQDDPDFNHAKPYSQVSGISTSGANHRFENVSVHDIDGRGFEHWSSSWSEADAQYGYEYCLAREEADPEGDPSSCEVVLSDFETDNTTFINCDAYNLFDWSSTQPGNAADGWKVGTNANNVITWIGCRAWSYSDDGFDPHGSGARVFDSCWAMSTDNYDGINDEWDIEGNGYKIPAVYAPTIPDYEVGKPTGTIIRNSIAANCLYIGFYNDIFTDYEDIWPNNALVHNNLSYMNAHGYRLMEGSDVRNNISYNSQSTGLDGKPQEIISPYTTYPASNNTWMPHDPSPGSWPFYQENPDYDVADDDFVSLDVSQLTLPRNKDGSLPDIEFGHLAPGSDLIDGGVVIEGYHCATAGEHPGEDCREWYGAAPDLGPFETKGGRF
jgi:hypothetical protein